jgi:glucosamine kinase
MALLIAESGSSKTDWRLVSETGNIIQLKTMGINPYFQNEKSIYQEIESKIVPMLTETVSQVFYYGTGITNIDMADIVKKAIKKAIPTAEIAINDDMLAAARSLCLNEPGIACILGTGSNSCLFDGKNIVEKIPALGFWLGDEGSGGYLGKELIKRFIRKELPDEIHQKFLNRFGNLERTEILEKAYKQPYPNRYLAGFSKFLFDNRQHPYVFQVIYDAFIQFFEKNVIQYPDYQQYKVHFTGSIAFYYSDILKKAAKKFGITIGVILESPIAGLVLFHKKM